MMYLDQYGRYRIVNSPYEFYQNNGQLVPADDYLSHSGILGMKWGKRNGPPYPLAYGRHSASEKKAGWMKSLENAAKATGKGVAKAAKATGRAAKATGKGVAKAAKATKKGLIRLNLYPKKLMSDQDILDKVERLKKEDLLKHMRGKLTNEDKALMKIKSKDAKREVVKQTLSQLLPAIGRDLVISQIKNKLDYKWDLKKKEDAEDREWDKKVAEDLYKDARDAGMSAWEASEVARKLGTVGKGKNAEEIRPQPKKSEEEKNRDRTVWNDIYEDARAAGKSATEARKAADEGDGSFAPRKKDNKNGGKGKGGNQFDLDSEVEKDIYRKGMDAGFTPTQSADMARRRDDSALRSSGTKTDNTNNQKKQDTKTTEKETKKETRGLSSILAEKIDGTNYEGGTVDKASVSKTLSFTNPKKSAESMASDLIDKSTKNLTGAAKEKAAFERFKDVSMAKAEATGKAFSVSGNKITYTDGTTVDLKDAFAGKTKDYWMNQVYRAKNLWD